MKTFLSLLLCITTAMPLFSQVPQAIQYQAVARDVSGMVLADTTFAIRFTIQIPNMPNPTILYIEQDTLDTNQFGIFTGKIGRGTPSFGSFADIPWGIDQLFLQVEIDLGNGYEDMGTSELLSVPYALYAHNGPPSGSVMAFAGDSMPEGWLLCDGSEVSRADFDGLFTAIGISWGTGNGTTTFNLPDLRGQFLRGVDQGAGVDPDASMRTSLNGGNTGDAVGSFQADILKSHNHPIDAVLYQSDANQGVINDESGDKILLSDCWNCGVPVSYQKNWPSLPFGGNETRPKNAYVNFIIKY